MVALEETAFLLRAVSGRSASARSPTARIVSETSTSIRVNPSWYLRCLCPAIFQPRPCRPAEHANGPLLAQGVGNTEPDQVRGKGIPGGIERDRDGPGRAHCRCPPWGSGKNRVDDGPEGSGNRRFHGSPRGGIRPGVPPPNRHPARPKIQHPPP